MVEAGNPDGSVPYLHTTGDTLAMMGDTAQPSVKFAQFSLAFLGETATTRAMHTGGPLLPLAKPWRGATRRCLRAATAAGSPERFEPVRVHVLDRQSTRLHSRH